MRILGVSKKWDKLRLPSWTTFRFARKDKDWYRREVVEVVYKPRSKDREILGQALIVDISPRQFGRVREEYCNLDITDFEARQDGFPDYESMQFWFFNQYGNRIFTEQINRLTVEWVGGDEKGVS